MLDKLMQHGIGVGGGSIIKSIQRGVFKGTTSGLLISPVDLNSSIIKMTTRRDAGGFLTVNTTTAIVYFNDSSSIVIEGGSGAENAWEVIEFDKSVVKNIQSGVFKPSTGSNSNSIQISPVNLNKSILFTTIRHPSSDGDIAPLHANIETATLSDEQTITIKSYTFKIRQVSWFVIEFK